MPPQPGRRGVRYVRRDAAVPFRAGHGRAGRPRAETSRGPTGTSGRSSGSRPDCSMRARLCKRGKRLLPGRRRGQPRRAGAGRGHPAVQRVRRPPGGPGQGRSAGHGHLAGQRGGPPGLGLTLGPGRPGWHAECAAMAMSVFGPAVDVHAGGADLRFPHHAYHAAMAEAFTGVRPYARAWLHVGTVTIAARRWPSRPATWCCSRSSWPAIRRRRSG